MLTVGEGDTQMCARAPAGAMHGARPVVMPKAVRYDFRSDINDRSYSLSVALPLVASPDKGSPVLYVLDGDWYFGSAVEAIRNNAPEVAVVGIGYPDDEAHIGSVLARRQPLPPWAREMPAFRAAVALERLYDLSLPASEAVLTNDFPKAYEVRESDVGGLEPFLRVVESEIKPRVASLLPIDSSNQALFGHSLGGLAVIHALFAAPGAFRTFVAASPAIWWNDGAVLDGEAKFADLLRATRETPRILVTMGSEEETPDPKIAAKYSLDYAEYSVRIRRARMVENARELTERLIALGGTHGFEVEEYAIFQKQAHGISPWPAIGRAVSFAYPP